MWILKSSCLCLSLLCVTEQEKREMSPRYQAWLAEQSVLEEFRQEEELRLQAERHRQWLVDEQLAQQQWRERQEKLARAREEKARQEVDHKMSFYVSQFVSSTIVTCLCRSSAEESDGYWGVMVPSASHFVSADLWPKSAVPVQHSGN